MTDIDIVNELRRLYEAAPQGKWETFWDVVDEISYLTVELDDCEVFGTVDKPYADLIVAMHNALPRLLDAVETERNFHRFLSSDESESVASLSDPDWWIEHNRLISARDAALAALDRSDG